MNLIGTNIAQYHIVDQLGEGGMATVYKAFDTRLEREVAIKVIRIDQFETSTLDHVLKRFDREAKILAKLSHPNIISILDYGEIENSPYLVMPYLPGGNLKTYIKDHGIFSWQEACKLLIPIADALQYAHNHNAVHRDVKPANILLNDSNLPLLSDFGVAKIFEGDFTQDLTGTSATVGTPQYMAPEQGLGKAIDKRADIYSLGVIFYEMITGRTPYQADTPLAVMLKQINEPLPSPKQFGCDIPESVNRVLYKTLAKNANDRYQSAEEFVKALQRILVEDTSPQKRKSKFKSVVFWLAGILLCLFIGTLIIMSILKSGSPKLVSEITNTATDSVGFSISPQNNTTNFSATSTPNSASVISCPPDPASPSVINAAQESFSQLIPNRQLIWFDDFNQGCADLLYGYNTGTKGNGSVELKNGTVELTSSSSTSDTSYLQSPVFSTGHGILIKFKFTAQTNWFITIVETDTVYNETESCIKLMDYAKTSELSFGNFNKRETKSIGAYFDPDRWYYYNVEIDSEGNAVQRVWPEDEPSDLLEMNYSNPNWADYHWILNVYPIDHVGSDSPADLPYHLFFDEITIYKIN